MARRGLLFWDGGLREFLNGLRLKMRNEVDALSEEQILGTNLDALADHFEDRFTVQQPVLRREEARADHQEVSIEPNGLGEVRYVPGRKTGAQAATRFTLHVPFDGDARVFQHTPDSYTGNPPKGRISGTEVLVEVVRSDHNSAATRASLEGQLNGIEQYLGFASNQVEKHNRGVRGHAIEWMKQRKEKLLADRNLVESLGYAVARREGASSTPFPVSRKTIRPLPQQPSSPGFRPEPAIEAKVYDDILDVLRSMSLAMERSPSTFSKLDEEEIRDHFIMALNGHFEGEATGETFNFGGKTDILIRHEGKNLFVAECKIWSGPKAFQDAIDQLLGYSTWRDCKLALLVFNRNKDFTSVLEKIEAGLPEHPNFRRSVQYGDETCFRCAVHHKDDGQREMTLTVLVFEVPSP